ncbi:trans-sulfuration enzyme family protein [Nocardiopsis chromatogenes]|uniref:trans-sulfuration enzyme family protein n=1 Tax=Nocardiopsis chromatogenes TaxID=280239 RepID=UPI00034A3293|nr:aminotransferase class I/II-fold pyridoxal phosphate-dependent enzyme [Nocardiopsis chromatogenes]
MERTALDDATRSVHTPVSEPEGSSPLGTPLHLDHLFSFATAEALAGAFDGPGAAPLYGRYSNPTVSSLEHALADLEHGAAATAYASGMGAVNAVVTALVGGGDHVIAQRALYGGTHALFTDLEKRWGVQVDRVSGDDPEEVRALLRPNTRLLYLETIANPTTRVSDVPALAAAAREAGVPTAVDNTFATPLLFRPLDHGADISLHSTSKYLSGHGDAIGGAAVFADRGLHRRVWEHGVELGACASPFNAWLTLRGLRTLALRMPRHGANAATIARRLAEHPAVRSVAHPDLPDHPDHALASRLLASGGGVLSFDLHGGRAAGAAFTEALEVASLAPSLGDVKTLAMAPASTSHHRLTAAELEAAGITEGTVRIAVGIEDPDDLWADIERALAAV